MTVLDPAFEGVGQEVGINIWRIEQMEVKPIPRSEYGNFYIGDSYIVLNTKQAKSGRLEWDIHFWLGNETSQDESGAAAIKSVELDDVLGGSPVQHREVQGHESALFLSYFKKGIRYLQGGVKSGFNHVEDESVKRLLRVKGRRNVRLQEMSSDISSMNRGDCFILDVGRNVYLYVGPDSGRMERIKAIQAANAIRDDVHHGRSTVKIIDGDSSSSEIDEFFEELGGGSPDDIADSAEGGDDNTFESELEIKIALFRVWEDDSNELQIELVSERPLKQEYLISGDCFLLDSGSKNNGIFLWVGKNSSPKERHGIMNLANKYLEMKNYPKWLPVKRIIDQGEPPVFKSFFSLWKDSDDQTGLGHPYTFEQIAASLPDEDCPDGFHALDHKKKLLLSKGIGKACGFMPDDGSGDVEIFRIEDFDIVPVNSSQYGIFFGGDSYIVKYTYQKNGSERYIIYFWQGKTSSQDEKATSAIMAVKMDNDLNGKAVQVRVVHGQEPEHFLRIFKGKMVILMGGHASGFKNIHDYDSFDVDGTRLFQVRGTNEYNIRAEQVPELSSSLNSNDVFLLETPSVSYIWNGNDSCAEEQAMGKRIVDIVSPEREIIEINEGDEPEEFWASLSGKTDYSKTRDLPSRPLLETRLFKLSNETGKLTVEEICNFTQEDLSEDDVMVLDAGDALYIWIGKGADEEEKEKSLEMAEVYINSDPTDRDIDNTLIVKIKQYEEPEAFKSYFSDWNENLWDVS
ncbi:gelsolin, cytoplasmic-like isoform X2 [Uloborus diversus]|uniref:gelsolin, cytoplasmic-like isoform X2 n=1 Tax=Uloborus diversus TaxID=327109 RepID=UPI0024093EEB|nr:gelsolin, cytoplasmic-like isoform X2 [Uloborus diversus]